jgi:hypothetical protein
MRVSQLIFVPQAGDQQDVTLFYQSSNVSVMADPGSGFLRTDAIDQSISAVAISDIDRNVQDQSSILALVEPGTRVEIQQSDSRFVTFALNAAPIDNTTWWEWPVTVVSTGDVFQNNANLDVKITFAAATLPQDTDTLDIYIAQEWPWVLYRLFNLGETAPKEQGVLSQSDIRVIIFE